MCKIVPPDTALHHRVASSPPALFLPLAFFRGPFYLWSLLLPVFRAFFQAPVSSSYCQYLPRFARTFLILLFPLIFFLPFFRILYLLFMIFLWFFFFLFTFLAPYAFRIFLNPFHFSTSFFSDVPFFLQISFSFTVIYTFTAPIRSIYALSVFFRVFLLFISPSTNPSSYTAFLEQTSRTDC